MSNLTSYLVAKKLMLHGRERLYEFEYSHEELVAQLGNDRRAKALLDGKIVHVTSRANGVSGPIRYKLVQIKRAK